MVRVSAVMYVSVFCDVMCVVGSTSHIGLRGCAHCHLDAWPDAGSGPRDTSRAGVGVGQCDPRLDGGMI